MKAERKNNSFYEFDDKNRELSLRNLSLDGKVLNVPLFMVDNLDKIIGVALQTLHA